MKKTRLLTRISLALALLLLGTGMPNVKAEGDYDTLNVKAVISTAYGDTYQIAKRNDGADKKASRKKKDSSDSSSSSSKGDPEFDSDGLLKMEKSDKAQKVVNHLLGPGTGFVTHTPEMDKDIDSLSTEEAIWVLHRIEGPGFGQTAAGLAGVDSPETHKALVDQQLNKRFDGSIHNLLKKWGTFSYSGY